MRKCEYCDALKRLGYGGCPTHAREVRPDKPPDCLCVLLGIQNPGLPREVIRRCCPMCRNSSPPAGLETSGAEKSYRGKKMPQKRNKRTWGVFGGFAQPAIARWMGADGWGLVEYRVVEDALGWPEADRKAVEGWLADGRAYPAEVPDLSFSDESKLYKTIAGDWP